MPVKVMPVYLFSFSLSNSPGSVLGRLRGFVKRFEARAMGMSYVLHSVDRVL